MYPTFDGLVDDDLSRVYVRGSADKVALPLGHKSNDTCTVVWHASSGLSEVDVIHSKQGEKDPIVSTARLSTSLQTTSAILRRVDM